jgi:hypothetical protein
MKGGVIQMRHATVNEQIKVRGKSSSGHSVIGYSGGGSQIAYNQALVSHVGNGNWGKGGPKDAKGARRFYNAVELAREEVGGKRSPWSCAEVNAVAKLLNAGAALQDITLRGATGLGGDSIDTCRACQSWSEAVGIPIG